MNYLMMKEYGSVLTGREFGREIMVKLAERLKYPVGLDFKGVSTMGSSFGDEVVGPIAVNQNKIINIRNANPIVRSCLSDIAEEQGIKIIYES